MKILAKLLFERIRHRATLDKKLFRLWSILCLTPVQKRNRRDSHDPGKARMNALL
jgi:hypothetical protein